MRMLLKFAEKPALLQLHVEALQGAVNGLVGLDGNVNQKLKCLRKAISMAQDFAAMRGRIASALAVSLDELCKSNAVWAAKAGTCIPSRASRKSAIVAAGYVAHRLVHLIGVELGIQETHGLTELLIH